MPDTHRGAILNEAKDITTKARNTAYGEPEDNFQEIADIWNWWLEPKLRERLTALDVGELMGFMKAARRKYDPTNRDSYVDGIGYLACAAQIALTASPGKPSVGESDPST